ncbi:MAG: SpoIID/LytB domain-containing protein [Deltaproteobacteria bacterium]|nr:SpoIID/LytB domain-containing protein [Deltaproteobacteria bacterium]
MTRRIALAAVLIAPALAAAQEGEDFTRRDRTALLYQTKFLFTADHVPIVNVGLMENVDLVRFSSDGPVEFLPEWEGGTSVRAGTGRAECRATLDAGRPARIRWWIALARVPARDLDAVRRERAAWEEKGFRIKTFQRGSVFGFFGRVLDNRTHVLVEDVPLDDAAGARARREEVANRTGVATVELFEEVLERPSGVVRVACQGVDAAMSFPGMVAVAAAPGKLLRVRDVEFGRGFSWHGREDRSYRGQIHLTAGRDGRLAIVNAIDAESLLKGLVPSEIWVDAPAEALKAQAVAARSELFAKLGQRHTADPYMVCGDVHCQAYRGSSREDPRTSRAVEATRGEMAFFGDALVDAVYSASCGGHTEAGAAVWQGTAHAYLAGTLDAPGGAAADPLAKGATEDAVRAFVDSPPKDLHCGLTRQGRESFRWQRKVPLEDVRKGVLEHAGADVGRVASLKVLARGVSGRVTRLEVAGDKGSAVLSPELTIRKALGGLRSSMFVHEVAGGEVRFRGGGFGHGVGMCQNGAVGMADRGRKYGEIVGHYYGGAEAVRIY